MSQVLARYLKDFGAAEIPPPPPSLPLDTDFSFDHSPVFDDVPVQPPVDIEAERADAYAQGQAATREKMLGEHEAELAKIAESHRVELEALREKYETAAAERITAGLREISSTLAQSISSELAVAVGPLMTDVLTEKAIVDLAALVEAAILEGDAGVVDVRGPRSLFDRLSSHLGDNAALLRHIEVPDVDLAVTIGESVLVTRMSAWADSLRKILA